jgi:hypothetical protein
MRVSHGEGVATHTGPESCATARKDGSEALTGEGAGRVLSREMLNPLRGADVLQAGGRPHPTRRQRETRWDPARSETPSTLRITSHGTREIPRPSAGVGAADRIGKSKDTRRW